MPDITYTQAELDALAEIAFEVALDAYHDWLAGECTSYGCRCGSDGCDRGES